MSVPVVPLSAFSNLAGAALAEDLRRLMANRDLTGLVLFSDTLGEHLAFLPLGPGQSYERVDDVAGVEIEGLRPLCALRLRGGLSGGEGEGRAEELARLEASLRERERRIAADEQRLADVGQALVERESMLDQREQMLLAKERDFFRRSGEMTRQVSEAAVGRREPSEAHA